mmetsp:Transcript_54424/g.80789  ORF Transcript_54424/g.80789 Transcript_54424/m.80789 type:complete len:163 (-) Transcript_54424:651-1139(-)|eukprot:CAMPEP_0195518574 /NCGR_PEP_ID=MMETSP0794_2-20130614/13218_1 /TAXON_ID=515487 /ORGANISM="Stephanopyxis turris, Strain CCMP 815" /LENGTH=162 /DNA_ID=CAMNT_0040647575 /DNA_START=49 /DNA_END=537 /DNA_ORIENTATION=+
MCLVSTHFACRCNASDLLAAKQPPQDLNILEQELEEVQIEDMAAKDTDVTIDGTTDQQQQKKTRNTHVSFSNIEIREFTLIIGDNPSCRTGLPLSLGWEHTKTRVVPVDDYDRKPRRSAEELLLNRKQSWMKLKSAGVPDRDMFRMHRDVEIRRRAEFFGLK